MSLPQPKLPKPDASLIAAQKAQAQAEQQRIAELKRKQLERTKADQAGTGIRSLVTGAGTGGYGRNFFG